MSVRCRHHRGPAGSSSGLPTPGSLTRCAPVATTHLFPVDVAGCYGDHGGFSHKPREEGAHAQGGSMYPGDENPKAICHWSRAEAHTEAQEPKPRSGVDQGGPDSRTAELQPTLGPLPGHRPRSSGLSRLPQVSAQHRPRDS